MIAIARSQPTQIARHPRALTLSAALHALVALAWLIAPTPKHDLGAGALTVQLLVEAPPPPEPPAPEPAKPEPPKPEPAKPPPEPKPAPVKPAPAPKPVPRMPAPAPVAATTSATSESAQPVMSSEPSPAPAATESAPAAPAVAVGAPNARSVERDDYLRMVWSRIMRHRPEKVSFAGTARLRFTLAADGALVAAELAESSGSGTLDRAALDALRRAAPFPAPPAGLTDPTFEIPFQFRPAG